MRCCATIQTIRFHLEMIFISYLSEVSSLHQQYAAIMGTRIGLRNKNILKILTTSFLRFTVKLRKTYAVI